MSKIVTGILAHVDAGKTTLSEALLYKAGTIRNLGRVDSKNSFLDNNSIERERGITIFCKQAELNENITLLDTPGHVDFSAEMERTLSVLDAAILVVSASGEIQSHVKTLWSLLRKHNIPTLIFINKMDLVYADSDEVKKTQAIAKIQKTFGEKIIDFEKQKLFSPEFTEAAAACDDSLMEKYLEEKPLSVGDIKAAIKNCNLFPCICGSALKLEGIEETLETLSDFFEPHKTENNFGAIAYKISYDKQGNRLTHLKVTGGILKVKDFLGEEKSNEVRIYSGEKYESVKEVTAGNICTVTGLKLSKPGMCYGNCNIKFDSTIESALIYSVTPPKEIDTAKMFSILKEIEDEFPELQVSYLPEKKELYLKLMGEIQTEVIKQLLKDRYNIEVIFGEGKIAYKETLSESIIGVGHYEPLKHYAEAHIKLTPLERGSGLKFKSQLSVDVLDTNWQRLIMTHLQEKTHIGVLTGSPITDMELEVVAGRSHLKHTEGGDFRQATYRAIRHGLMCAKEKNTTVLLEPVYNFEIMIPSIYIGRVMSDIERMQGFCQINETDCDISCLTGKCPVSTMQNYINELRSFSKGQGTISLTLSGYEKCHNAEEVISQIGYNPDADLENPAGSVFCSHGAGFAVNWNEVLNYKHL